MIGFPTTEPESKADLSLILDAPNAQNSEANGSAVTFDTDRFRREGRLHVEKGYSLFDYVGAIFTRRDFHPGNEKRLQEKLDTVIEYEERFRLYEEKYPGKKYFVTDTINAFPEPKIDEQYRITRRASLTAEIQAKLAAMPLPETPLPQEKTILDCLSQLPAKAQQWLYDNNVEISFSAEKEIGKDGKEQFKGNKGLFAPHPAAHEHDGGGGMGSFRPWQPDAIKYASFSPMLNPVELLAHEALGHGLFNLARRTRGDSEILQQYENAAVSDLGDVNKLKKDNPDPDNGRLGKLMGILASTKDDKELLAKLQAFDPQRVPVFTSDAQSQKWLADVRTLAASTWPTLGPDSWTYTQPDYRQSDGSYSRDLTINEIGAIVGQKYLTVAKGKEKELSFVIPSLTAFWERELIPLMDKAPAQVVTHVIKPDLSLIRDYTLADDQPKPNTIRRYSNGEKELFYINASHVIGTDNPTCDKIREAIETLKPQRIIVEGRFEGNGKREPIPGNNELAFADAMAHRHKIPVIGGEPSDTAIFNSKTLTDKGYTTKDVMALYLLRTIEHDRREGKPMDEAHFAERAAHYLASNPAFEHIPQAERLTYEQFKAEYAPKLGNKNFLDATTNDFAPFVTENATFFQQLNAAIGHIREEHLDTVIGNTLSEAGVNKMLVVYGGGHRTISEPVWESALGKGIDVEPAREMIPLMDKAPEPEFKADLSLILDKPNAQNKDPIEPPYLKHYHKGEKDLYYIASPHASGIETDTFKTVAKAIEDYKPDMVVVEGVKSSASKHYLQGVIEQAKHSEANSFSDSYEGPYAALLAERNHIAFTGGEPTDEAIFAGMKTKGYSAKDTMAYYLLRLVPYWKQKDLPMDEASVEKRAREFLADDKCFGFVIPDKERLTLEEFKAWYNEHNDKPERRFSDCTWDDIGPMNTPDANYFHKLSYAMGPIRDKNIVATIGDAVARHNKVLVVYGSYHLFVANPVFEKMFGEKGKATKIIEPEALPSGLPYRNDWSQQPRNAPDRAKNAASSGMSLRG